MPEVTSYEHGVPSWVDVGVGDLAAAVAFYSELFGWQTEDQGEEFGHYTMCLKGGKPVAAIGGRQDGVPSHWTTYVDVDDIADVARRVESAGGKVLSPPMEIPGAGHMAVFSDTTGATVAAWQPTGHAGAGIVNEAGALMWNELSTSDLAAARSFYTEVFGWGWLGDDAYDQFQVGGRSVGGAQPRPEGMAAEIPDSWLVYLGTDDLDADTARVRELGGSVQMGPMQVPGMGRFSVVADPQGAVFALFEATA